MAANDASPPWGSCKIKQENACKELSSVSDTELRPEKSAALMVTTDAVGASGEDMAAGAPFVPPWPC